MRICEASLEPSESIRIRGGTTNLSVRVWVREDGVLFACIGDEIEPVVEVESGDRFLRVKSCMDDELAETVYERALPKPVEGQPFRVRGSRPVKKLPVPSAQITTNMMTYAKKFVEMQKSHETGPRERASWNEHETGLRNLAQRLAFWLQIFAPLGVLLIACTTIWFLREPLASLLPKAIPANREVAADPPTMDTTQAPTADVGRNVMTLTRDELQRLFFRKNGGQGKIDSIDVVTATGLLMEEGKAPANFTFQHARDGRYTLRLSSSDGTHEHFYDGEEKWSVEVDPATEERVHTSDQEYPTPMPPFFLFSGFSYLCTSDDVELNIGFFREDDTYELYYSQTGSRVFTSIVDRESLREKSTEIVRDGQTQVIDYESWQQVVGIWMPRKFRVLEPNGHRWAVNITSYSLGSPLAEMERPPVVAEASRPER